MARKVRLFLEDTPQYILLRGVNQESIFIDAEDFTYGLGVLKELCDNLLVHLHAYVLMPNQIELLCTPLEKDAISRMMQGFGIKYVAYFNKKYNRNGTLWEGRYRSSLVENCFVLSVMHFIESEPCRLGYAQKTEEYRYSSFQHNTQEVSQSFVVAHKLYELLASTKEERYRVYKHLSSEGLSETLVSFIQMHIFKQTIIGTPRFYEELAQKIGEIVNVKKVGRPKKKETQQRSTTMYQNLVLLNKENHKNLKINPMTNLSFAKQSTTVPVVANEISLIGKDFPVVFTGGEQTSLVALTSLGGDNLAINAEGKYIVSYVPAFLRRYPFALGANQQNAEQQLVLIDEASELFSHSKGKQLFTKDGNPSETLNNAIQFLQGYETEQTKTNAVVQEIKQSGILEEREISVGEGETKKVLVNGFLVVSREKLNALGDEILASWVRRGIISFIDAHLNSLAHIQTLFNLAHARQN
ncbi:SapC family protein [Sulfurospirillum sp. 'SP']|nr:SapC family protein [Sulfurospirillum sp. 'SP']WNZ00163.1 SapC family protein [Sulfurospirillum sp. 'SP']